MKEKDLQQKVVVGSFSECRIGTLGQGPLGSGSSGCSHLLLRHARTTGYPNQFEL